MNSSPISRQNILQNNGKAWILSLKMKGDFNGWRTVQAKRTAKTQKSKNTLSAQGMLVYLVKGEGGRRKRNERYQTPKENMLFNLLYLNTKRETSFLP